MSKKNTGRTKGERRADKRASAAKGQHRRVQLPSEELELSATPVKASRKPLEAKTPAQGSYINAIDTYDLVFAKGPAGTGKTFVAAAKAAELMLAKQINKIIITRPAVGAEEEYGFFPGDLDEKVAPWAAPVIAILEQRLGAGHVEYLLKAKRIEIAPLGMLRGHTFEDAFIIFDEAQNATRNQMKLFLTRLGENVKCVVDGDPEDQTDIRVPSGFSHAWNLMHAHPRVGFVEFGIDDIVRSGLVRDILIRYNTEKKESTVGQTELESFLRR